MAWRELSLETDAGHADALADALSEAGALSTSIEDAAAGTPEEEPQFGEPGSPGQPLWSRSRVTALFDPDVDIGQALRRAAGDIGLESLPEYDIREVAEQDWVRVTQAQFEPIEITPRMWIVPSWHEAPHPDAVNIELDPGLAFGTGSHPTTRLCLEWLTREIHGGERMLDYGCGSGILAIAAARLGAGEVVGADIDPQAVSTARDNAARNGVRARFLLSSEEVGHGYDIVVANILANPLKLLAPALAGHLRDGGRLALSGILEEQAEEMIEIYHPWVELEVAGRREGWVCLAGVRPIPSTAPGP